MQLNVKSANSFQTAIIENSSDRCILYEVTGSYCN